MGGRSRKRGGRDGKRNSVPTHLRRFTGKDRWGPRARLSAGKKKKGKVA